MCLILFSYQQSKEYKLILAANRDEFYERPTKQAGPWDDVSGLIAGKDLQAGGTWLGIHSSGRFGMVTNYREPALELPSPRSRGNVVLEYLTTQKMPSTYLSRLQVEAKDYSGFNSLIGDPDSLWYYSNRSDESIRVQPGLYGLSNHLLDTPWPKVLRGKALFESVINQKSLDVEALFNILRDDQRPPDHELPQTGVPLHWERTLSSMFIKSDGYGTRCSTIMLIKERGEMEFYERTYPIDRSAPSTVHYTL